MATKPKLVRKSTAAIVPHRSAKASRQIDLSARLRNPANNGARVVPMPGTAAPTGGRIKSPPAQQMDLTARAQLYGATALTRPSNDIILGQHTTLSTLGGVWFSPGQPLKPVAQDASRQFDYPFAYNLRIQPREGEEVTFEQLRALADYDILRLILETRKDQIAAFDWEILRRDLEKDTKPTPEEEAQIDQMTAFFQSPSLEPNINTWDNWLRAFLEDMFVIDAVVIEPRYNVGGDKVLSLDLVDGGSFKRLLSETGRTPLPPDPAYQQVLHGLPAVDKSYFSTWEPNEAPNGIIYWMRNPRTNRIYGLSPVEQVVLTVNIAIRKTMFELNFFTEGNIPEAFCGTPETWTAEQVKNFQLWWDAMMEGDLAQRRKMKFVPIDPSKMRETHQQDLKDDYSEWLVRILCFALSIPPTPFIRQLNRSTAQTSQQSAEDEGLMPLLKHIKGRLDWLLAKVFNLPKLEFKFKMKDENDPNTQSQIDDRDIRNGKRTIDECREALGLDPLGIDEPLLMTPTGPIPLLDALKSAKAAYANPHLAPTTAPVPPGLQGSQPKPPAEGEPQPVAGAAGAAGGKEPVEPKGGKPPKNPVLQ